MKMVGYPHVVIPPGGLEVVNYSADVILELEIPTTKNKLRSCVGLGNEYSRFVPEYACVVSPLTAKQRKSHTKQLALLNVEKLKELGTLHEKLTSPKILPLPRKKRRCTVDMATCDRQIECVLLQT